MSHHGVSEGESGLKREEFILRTLIDVFSIIFYSTGSAIWAFKYC